MASRSDVGVCERLRKLILAYPRSTLASLTLLALAPFLAKPFNMDDPLFIWAAKNLFDHPGNPYGFTVNWFGSATPMWDATKNPPLCSYYLSFFGEMFGWSEVALHGAMLLPASAAILGTFRLARRFCKNPFFAALVVLFTPAFLVSATTVMSDVLLLAFWIWAVVFWVERKDGHTRTGKPCLSGVLMGLAALTKYYGATLIPLLLCYELLKHRRVKLLYPLVIPVAVLIAYSWWTSRLYGRFLFGEAIEYTHWPNSLGTILTAKLSGCLTALTFTGGCVATAVFFSPLLWRWRTLALIATGSILFSLALLIGGVVLKDYGPLQGTTGWFVELQIIIWACGGTVVLWLALTEIYLQRDVDSWLLGLWVLGTFLFAGLINWTVNGRSILPMVPAVAILLVRRLERNATGSGRQLLHLCWVSGAALALLVATADYRFALASRRSAQKTFEKYGRGSARFWFQGHWGYQYYMEALGALPLDRDRTVLRRGDIVAIPENNTGFLPLNPQLAVLREVLAIPGPGLLATVKGEVGAGFYASIRGPLPFALANSPPDLVTILQLEPTPPN